MVLAFDMDDAGNIAAAEVCKIYPEAMRANLPAKDANECLVKGHKKSLKNSVLFKAAAPSNSKLVYGDSLTESACREAEMGQQGKPLPSPPPRQRWHHLGHKQR